MTYCIHRESDRGRKRVSEKDKRAKIKRAKSEKGELVIKDEKDMRNVALFHILDCTDTQMLTFMI